MLRSMTGFGAAASEDAAEALRVETRSVNHRHLTIKTRLPDELAYLEGDVERSVRAKLERGAVSVTLTFPSAACAAGVKIDAAAAERYRDELEAVARRLGIEPKLSLEMLLALPGVVSAGADGRESEEAERRRVVKLVDAALERLIAMRETEGRAIEVDLKKHALATEKLVARVERAMPRVVRAHQKNLARRVSELIGRGTDAGSAEFAREVALLADRLDVSEEISRLKSHLEQLARLLAEGGRIGRQLDFLVQEIFREVNTIGAKCSDAQIAHWVVEAKTHVERLREQVQNVE